jgi:DNA-binding HxlR family transcriptional regulator
MAGRRLYDQYCPIGHGLDLLGERWTLLILRELLGGPRRYSDLRAELPGIATNLLAERLRQLEDEGLIEREDLPPPAARTVYVLSDVGWRDVPPVLAAIARFGARRLPPGDGPVPPLTGFLAAIVVGFDAAAAGDQEATYQIDVDGRLFTLAVRDRQFGPARSSPQVRMSATAADLLELRLNPLSKSARELSRRITLEGPDDAVAAFRATFRIPG